MPCNHCGAAVAPRSRFCSNCGASIALVNEGKCASCGATLKAGAKYCQGCGQPVGQIAHAAPATAAIQTDEIQAPAHKPRSPWVTLSLLLGIPIVVGIMFLLFYPRSNPQPAMSQQAPAGAMPQATQQNGQDPFDMAAMAPVFQQIDSLKNAVQQNPKDTNALLHLAALFDMAGKYEQAAGYYRDLLAVTPENVEARMNLAGNYFNLKQNEAAIAELQTALQHRPNYDYAMFNLGVIYAAIHEHEKAAAWWNKVIALDASSELASRARESLKTLDH